MQMTKALIVVISLSLTAATPMRAQDLTAAETFVRSIYVTYRADATPTDLTGREADRILAPSLLLLLREDEAALKGEIGVLDYDPICDCQDFDIHEVHVSVALEGDRRARATVRFKNFGRPSEVRLDLVTHNGAWRIFDIHESGLPSLRKALEDEISSEHHPSSDRDR